MTIPSPQLPIHVNSETRGSLSILSISGEFSFKNIHHVENEWRIQMEKKPETIAINCAELHHLDSSALGKLIWFNDNAAQNNIKLVFYDINSVIGKLLATFRLNNFFLILTKQEFEKLYLQSS
jgi:anti-anti-sigma factor